MISVDLDIEAFTREQERRHYHAMLDKAFDSDQAHFLLDIHEKSVVSFEFSAKEKPD